MSFLDLIYPKKCFSCGKTGKYFCDTCLPQIILAPESSFFMNKDSSLNGVVSLFNYQGLARLSIHKLKYRFLTDSQKEWFSLVRFSLGQKLTAQSGWRLKRFLLTMPQIVPVPLYWRRKNWRGFNQAELIATWVAENLKLSVNSKLVRRLKSTQPQVGLPKEKRRANVSQAFQVIGDKVPRTVLVVDDVWTSGATIKAVAESLKVKGVKEIWGLTLAR